jgi:hypothetical protein
LAFSYWFDKPWFLTEGKFAVVLIISSLGVPNWSVIYINTAPQSGYVRARATLPLHDEVLRKYRIDFKLIYFRNLGWI